jgi:hypothetical protein
MRLLWALHRWAHRRTHKAWDELACTCQTHGYLYTGRQPVYPGALIPPNEIEVIHNAGR